MIHSLLALVLLQDPTPPIQPPPVPVPAPEKQDKPARSRDERLEDRVVVDPAAKVEPAVPPQVQGPATEPAPPKPADDALAGWNKLNSVVLVVNEEAVTYFDVQRGMQRSLRDRKGGDPEQVFNDVISNRAQEELEVQGGKDLGFDPAQVDRFVRDRMDLQSELAGSVTTLASELKRQEMSSFDRREEIYSWVYRELWEDSVTGKSPSPGGRVSRDRYVRPGWAMLVQRMAARRQVEGRTVQLTQMVLVSDAPGGLERQKQRLEELRLRIENGEDMGELSEQAQACPPGTRGLSPFMNLEGLRANNPDVAAFLDTAQVGELSPVLEFLGDGKLVGYVVVRAEEFKSTGKVEPFDDPKGQRTWIDGQRQRIHDWRVKSGITKLLGAAYVWPPQAFRAPEQKP